MARWTCLFSGSVQGVGFRYTVMNLSYDYEIVGYVRNTSDGRVELVMEGQKSECMGLLDEVKQQMSGYIDDVKLSESPGTGEFDRFSIRH